jgi:hypothetical protein
MTAWHLASQEGHLKVLNKLWKWANQVLTQEDLKNKVFLAKDNYGTIAWRMAAERGHLEVLDSLWVCATEILTPEEIYKKLFLVRDNFGKTVWHPAGVWSDEGMQHQMLEWINYSERTALACGSRKRPRKSYYTKSGGGPK